MTTFGDFDPADAADPSRPDGEALARIFVQLCRQVTRDAKRPATLEQVPELERVMLLFVFAYLADRLTDEWGLK